MGDRALNGFLALGLLPPSSQARLWGRHTYDGSSRPLRPGDGAVRDPQGEGLAVALVYLHLPPDAKLAHGAPASGEANELDLWCPGEGPGHDDRLVGWLWTVANLEKEAKAAGCWKEACGGARAAVTQDTGPWWEKLRSPHPLRGQQRHRHGVRGFQSDQVP